MISTPQCLTTDVIYGEQSLIQLKSDTRAVRAIVTQVAGRAHSGQLSSLEKSFTTITIAIITIAIIAIDIIIIVLNHHRLCCCRWRHHNHANMATL